LHGESQFVYFGNKVTYFFEIPFGTASNIIDSERREERGERREESGTSETVGTIGTS
jgi:hypothetical protein